MSIIREELEEIRIQNDGYLKPADVLTHARENEGSALHGCFDWDNKTASDKWRLFQAGQIIRVQVKVDERSREKIRAYVSLLDNRKTKLGYVHIDQVLENEQETESMIELALSELSSFERKYRALGRVVELRPVFDAISQAVA